MDHRSLPSLETPFEDAIYNDAPNCFRSDCLRDGSPTQAQDSPFEAKHRCSRKSIKRDLHLCVSSSNVKSEFARSPTRLESILFVDPPLLTRTHCMYARACVCACALLTRNIDRQPSSVTRASNCRELVRK